MTLSLEQYKTFLDTIPDAAMLVDSTGVIVLANIHLHSLLGYPPGQLAGQPMHVIVRDWHSDQTHQLASYFAAPTPRCPRTRPLEVHVTRRDGGEMPVGITLAPHNLTDPPLTLCLVRDMTALHLLQATLKESEAKFRSLVEHATEVFYAVTLGVDPLRANVTYVSPQAESLTGHSWEEFVKDSSLWPRLIHPQDISRLAATTLEVLEQRRPGTREYRIRHDPDGHYRWVSDHVVPRYDALGRPVGYQGVARDITDRWWQEHQARTLVTLGRALRDAVTPADRCCAMLDHLMPVVEASGGAFVRDTAADGESVVELARGTLAEWTGTPLTDVSGLVRIPIPRTTGPVRTLIMLKDLAFADEEVQLLNSACDLLGTALQRLAFNEELSRRAAAVEDSYETTIEGWAQAIERREGIAEGHTARVTDLTVRLARHLGIGDDDLCHIRRGAVLHDIGKMAVPEHILRKPGPLTETERAEMHRHPEHAYDLLGPADFLRPALEIPSYHHERWNGSGYPRGIAGAEIPLAARIFAVADVYDAMTSMRPYGQPQSHPSVLEFIVAESGRLFDPQVVNAFQELMEDG